MADYPISKEAVIRELINLRDRLGGPFAKEVLDMALARLEGFPQMDGVPVVHARWVHEQRYGDFGGWVWRCSACRREAISPIISALKYCHSCGAKMDAKDMEVPTKELDKTCPTNGAPCNECVPGAYCAKKSGGAEG